MSKQFTTIKVGYSTGVYGCSSEYFTTIIVRGTKMFGVHHSGMYGSDDRVNAVLKDAGYKETYTPSYFGKMTRADYGKAFLSEYGAIEEVQYIIKNGKYPQ